MVELDPEIGALLLPGMTVTGHFFALSDGSWCVSIVLASSSQEHQDCGVLTVLNAMESAGAPASSWCSHDVTACRNSIALCHSGTLRSQATCGRPTTTPHAATAPTLAPCLIQSPRTARGLSTERQADSQQYISVATFRVVGLRHAR